MNETLRERQRTERERKRGKRGGEMVGIDLTNWSKREDDCDLRPSECGHENDVISSICVISLYMFCNILLLIIITIRTQIYKQTVSF